MNPDDEYDFLDELAAIPQYGSGSNLTTSIVQEVLTKNFQEALAMKAESLSPALDPSPKFWDSKLNLWNPKELYLFIGGPAHGKRLNAAGGWWTTKTYKQSPYVSWPTPDEIVAPELNVEVHEYQRQTIYGWAGIQFTVYISMEEMKKGLSHVDSLLGKVIADEIGPKKVFGNELKKSEPLPAPESFDLVNPITDVSDPVPEGVRITIGDRTVEWELDSAQLAGILNWAENSLGQGKDIF